MYLDSKGHLKIVNVVYSVTSVLRSPLGLDQNLVRLISYSLLLKNYFGLTHGVLNYKVALLLR